MEKTKRIIVSLLISLVVILTVNIITVNYAKEDYISVSIFNKGMFKGSKVQEKDISTIQVKKTNESAYLKQDVTQFLGKTLMTDVEQGEIVFLNQFGNSEEILEKQEGYKYISIPITETSYPTCNKLRKGDKVSLYYTAKSKNISNAIKDKQRLYSNTEKDGFVTCLLFDSVEVISFHDSTGKETGGGITTSILLRLNTEDVLLIANLKEQGTFDVVLN